MTNLAAWLTQIWDEEERQFDAACEAEAAYLRSDGLPGETAESVREFWLSPEAGTDWPLRLARIAADRNILALQQKAWARSVTDDPDPEGVEWLLGHRWGLHEAVKLLALPYADRPGYQEAWRP